MIVSPAGSHTMKSLIAVALVGVMIVHTAAAQRPEAVIMLEGSRIYHRLGCFALQFATGRSVERSALPTGAVACAHCVPDDECMRLPITYSAALPPKSCPIVDPPTATTPSTAGRQPAVTGTTAATGTTLPSEAYGSPDGKLKVLVEARVTETNDTWSRFAWKLTATNSGTSAVTIRGSVEFQDRDGFPIDDARVDPFSVAAGETTTQTGFALIRAAVAGNVRKVAAKIGR